jgi:hypothetical protein
VHQVGIQRLAKFTLPIPPTVTLTTKLKPSSSFSSSSLASFLCKVRDSQGTRDNVYVEDGTLVLRSQRQRMGKFNYTSAAVSTQAKASWRGLTRACVSAKLPGGQGQPQPNSSSPDWCTTTPFGKCHTGCPANSTGTCGPDKQHFGPGVPGWDPSKGSCNECNCNRDNTTCDNPSAGRPDSQGVRLTSFLPATPPSPPRLPPPGSEPQSNGKCPS